MEEIHQTGPPPAHQPLPAGLSEIERDVVSDLWQQAVILSGDHTLTPAAGLDWLSAHQIYPKMGDFLASLSQRVHALGMNVVMHHPMVALVRPMPAAEPQGEPAFPVPPALPAALRELADLGNITLHEIVPVLSVIVESPNRDQLIETLAALIVDKTHHSLFLGSLLCELKGEGSDQLCEAMIRHACTLQPQKPPPSHFMSKMPPHRVVVLLECLARTSPAELTARVRRLSYPADSPAGELAAWTKLAKTMLTAPGPELTFRNCSDLRNGFERMCGRLDEGSPDRDVTQVDQKLLQAEAMGGRSGYLKFLLTEPRHSLTLPRVLQLLATAVHARTGEQFDPNTHAGMVNILRQVSSHDIRDLETLHSSFQVFKQISDSELTEILVQGKPMEVIGFIRKNASLMGAEVPDRVCYGVVANMIEQGAPYRQISIALGGIENFVSSEQLTALAHSLIDRMVSTQADVVDILHAMRQFRGEIGDDRFYQLIDRLADERPLAMRVVVESDDFLTPERAMNFVRTISLLLPEQTASTFLELLEPASRSEVMTNEVVRLLGRNGDMDLYEERTELIPSPQVAVNAVLELMSNDNTEAMIDAFLDEDLAYHPDFVVPGDRNIPDLINMLKVINSHDAPVEARVAAACRHLENYCAARLGDPGVQAAIKVILATANTRHQLNGLRSLICLAGLLTARGSSPIPCAWVKDRRIFELMSAVQDRHLRAAMLHGMSDHLQHPEGMAAMQRLGLRRNMRRLAPCLASFVRGLDAQAIDRCTDSLNTVLTSQGNNRPKVEARLGPVLQQLGAHPTLTQEQKSALLQRLIDGDAGRLLERIVDIQTMLAALTPGQLRNVDFTTTSPRDLNNAVLLEILPRGDLQISNAQFMEAYIQRFANSREPNALLEYAARMHRSEYVEARSTLGRYVAAVVQGRYSAERYLRTQNPHLQEVFRDNVELEIKWRRGETVRAEDLSKKYAGQGLRVRDTDSYMRLLTCGNLGGSCQGTARSVHTSHCLANYLMDGKIRALIVTGPDGKTETRAILRILWDKANNTPVLQLEGCYSDDPAGGHKNLILQMAMRRAQALNLPLVTVNREYLGGDPPMVYQGTPFSLWSPSREYVDAREGIEESHQAWELPEPVVLSLPPRASK